jgi:ATP-dependent DNA helicase RecG
MSDHLMFGLDQITLPSTLRNASWDDLLLHLVPSWTKKGIQLHPLDWPDNQVYDKGDIEKIPSWTQKSTHLLRKKAWYLIGILSVCSAPIKFQRMLEAFNYKNEKTFRDNYIKPLRNVGFITMTIPEKPTDPENKYVITEEGKSFLSGQFVYPNSSTDE